MLQLRRWPNGETRVVDTETLMASGWLRSAPSGPLAAVPLEYDCSAGPVTLTIASNAPDAEANAWMPPDYDVLRTEGEGAVPPPLPRDAATQQRMHDRFRQLMHYDEEY
jgi:hypothetical protein